MSGLDRLLLAALVTLAVMVLIGRRPWAGIVGMLLYGLQLVLLWPLAGGAAASFHIAVPGDLLHWRLDGLGWFFGLITVGAAAAASLFAAGPWARGHEGRRLMHISLAANVAAMLLLLSSGDLLTLFVGWELVSWAGFTLMLNRVGAPSRPAYRYLIYATTGAMAILAAILILAQAAGGFGIAAGRAALAAMPAGELWVVAGLFVAGFAVKMALLPFHLWQADAYAEAPGPAAAFLGAIVSRMGLFALAVVLFRLVGIERLAGLTVPFTFLDARILLEWVAAFTMIVPTFIALTQSDARRLLAWHGIGQGGYMLLGLLLATPMGVAGGLLHVFNHATYQAALFLSITAVVYRTGTADLDRLGGLITRMPLSYVTMLLGIIGLAGLPPMNGFVSKWIIYQALLQAHRPLLFIAAIIGTLGTILSVYKLIHNTFLGQLRLEHAEVREVPWTMTVPMLALGGLALLTGIFPGLALDLVDRAEGALGVTPLAHTLGGVTSAAGSLDMRWVVGMLVLSFGAGALIFFAGGRSRRTHQYDTYAGGHFLTAQTRYQYSHDFYAGLMRATGPWYRGSILWAERGLVALADLLGSASRGIYRLARGPLYLTVAAVIALGWFAVRG